MTPELPAPPRLPGTWLLAIARLVFDEAAMDAVVHQTIADLRDEWLRAGSDRRARLAARARGALAFWSIVATAPFAFRRWPRRPTMPLFYLVLGFLAYSLLTGGLTRLPDSALGVLAFGSPFAFLAGPMAMTALGLRAGADGARRFFLATPEAVLLSLLSVTMAAMLGTAALMDAFNEIGRTGTASFIRLTQGVLSPARSMVWALATMAVCVVAFAAWTLRASPLEASATRRPMSAGSAAGATGLLAVVLLAVNHLLGLHHEAMSLMQLMLSPAGITGGSSRMLARQAEAIPEVLTAGGVLTVVVLALGVTFWRNSREHEPHPVLVWSSRVALVLTLSGAAWHAQTAQQNLDALEQLRSSSANNSAREAG